MENRIEYCDWLKTKKVRRKLEDSPIEKSSPRKPEILLMIKVEFMVEKLFRLSLSLNQ